MMITERQEKLLNTIIQEYINSAGPVSSQLLEKKYDFDICPATIRIEMQKLTHRGYLFQPHTSAGRIPTDKGYRYFVNNLKLEDFKMGDWSGSDLEDIMRFTHALTKRAADISQSLVLAYLEKENLFWKEGWEELLQEPEFGEKNIFSNFTNLLENFEKRITEKCPPEINKNRVCVYIGKENPFSKEKDFTIISSQCSLPNNEELILALFGPKRMPYDKNISLINSLIKTLENL